VAGLAASFGSGAMTNSIAEIEDADCIFIIGSNTSVAHPLIAWRVFRAKAMGAKVLIADPRRIPLVAQADLYVRQKPGTDVALLNGMMHVILKNDWQNQAFIEERTENFEAFKAGLENYPPERAAEITGVAVDDIVRLAQLYAWSEKSTILYTMGITQHTTGVDNVKCLANLAMLCGHIGRWATGVNPLRGQNNVQGACDMGGLPNVYPAYQSVADLAVRERFLKAWQVDALSDKIGLTIMEMMHGIEEGKIKALVVLGENPLLSDPDTLHVEKALKACEFLAVIDIFPTETAQLAQVVLPAAAFAEKDGTFANTERRVQRVRKAVDPPGEAKPDWWIIQELATRFGYPMDYDSPREIQEEIRQVAPSYGGISYERLDGQGLVWPCPTADHPGTPFLHKDRFARGKGLFHAIEFKEPAEMPDAEFPFVLTTGRFHMHYHTGTMTRNSPSLEREGPEQAAEIHPLDARTLELKDGDLARIRSRRGEILSKVTLTDRVSPGLVFLSFHYGESNANLLTNTALDPIAKIPELKVCAVKVEKASEV
jgi:formate dehydrogenase alpha subunit